jgi:VanZ family protein
VGKVISDRRGRLLTGLRWVLVGTWTGFIWWLVTLPEDNTPDVSYIPLGDKLGHAAMFCLWAILVCWAIEKSFRVLSRKGAAVFAVVGAVAYGVAVEIYQAGIGRDADVLDALADLAGALIAVYLYHSPGVKRLLRKALGTLAIRGVSVKQTGPSLPAASERRERYGSSDLEEDKK